MKIAVSGAHGKSTTSAMIGTILHDVPKRQSTKYKVQRDEVFSWGATTITGTLVKAFGGKNICIEGQDIMNIEACEYRNSFLKYHPDIAVVTNIDPDHLDFFKTEAAYTEAFQAFARSAKCLVILSEEEKGKDMIGCALTTVIVFSDYYEVLGEPFNGIEPGKYNYSLPTLLVP
jgi:UDP-N-acetylmuramate--alanine ligase